MMNFPFKLREQTKLLTPKGPSFSFAKRVSFNISGTQMEFRAPSHRYRYVSIRDFQERLTLDFNDMNFESYKSGLLGEGSWRYCMIVNRAWDFYGPWFTGPIADMRMTVSILTPTEPNPNVSFFHPRAFEQAVGDFLTSRFSLDMREGRSQYNAPINWQPITHLPSMAARLDVMPDEHVNRVEDIIEYFFLPLNDQHLLQIRFIPRQNLNKSLAERDKLVDRSTMAQLRDDILDSLKITLSPEALQQQASALEGLEDTSLIKSYPPIKWTTPEQDAEWEEHKKDIERYSKM